MANENLEFRKGNLANLAGVPIKNGTIIFTLDEQALYLDADSQRKRLGNFIEVQTEDELYYDGNLQNPVEDSSTWATNALYYVVENNSLLRWTGEEWIRINTTSDAELALQNLQSTVDSLSNSVSQIESDMRSYETNIQNLQTAIETEQKAREEYDTTVSAQIQKLKDKDTQIENSMATLEESNRDLTEQLQQEIEDRTAADTQIREDYAAADDTLKAELEKGYKDAVAAEKTEREAAETLINNDISQKYEELNTLKSTVGTLTESLQDEVTARGQTDKNVESVREEIARVEKEYKEADQELEDIINQLTSSDFSALEATVREHTTQLTTLTGDKDTEGSVDYKIQQAIDNLSQGQEGAVGALREDLEKQIEDTKTELNNNISSLEEELRQEVTTRESEITRVEGDYAAADKQTLEEAKEYTDSMLSTADAMTFKGVLTEYEDLPTVGVNAGDTYKVGENGQYGPTNEWAYIGDLFIALADQGEEDAESYSGEWAHISSGYEVSFDPTLSVGTEKEEAQLQLYSGIGVLKSSITFKPQEKSNVVVTMDKDALSFGLAWGEF